MPGKVWAHCMGLALCTLGCAGNPPAAAPPVRRTVVVNLEGAAVAPRSAEERLPARGAVTAPVTIVALLDFSDVESAAVYQALRRLQDRLGERELRLVLVTPGVAESAEVMADTLARDHGDAAYFDFATRVFASPPAAFGDTLRLALDVGLAHARAHRDPPKAGPDSSLPVVRAEADALIEAPDTVIPALSVNGIRVFGRLLPAQFEALVTAEDEAARALGRTGIAAAAVYPERVAKNAERTVRGEADQAPPPSVSPEPVPPPEVPPPTQAEAPGTVTASHILFAYQGALRASPQITRTQAEARALAVEVLGRLRRGAIEFDEAAARFSDEPGAVTRKGALGSFRRETMVKPFGDAAFALEPGELSDIVETDFGFHIIWRQK